MATLQTSSSSSSSQSYYLRFSSHTAALSRSLLNLLSESYCTDVHISTGHQSQTIRAHKIILSAFSPYFKSLFSNLPTNQFPVIIIREISYDILRTIIEFCYRGEILVSRDKLDDIVSAAKFLQIEGAKDFIIPKPQTLNQTQTNASSSSAKMQIDLQAKLSQTKNIITIPVQPASHQQTQQTLHHQLSNQRTHSLLSKMVQKPPINIAKTTIVNSGGGSSSGGGVEPETIPIKISGVRHINEREFVDLEDEEDDDDDDEDIDDDDVDSSNNNQPKKGGGSSDDKHSKSSEKSGMFAEFEDHVVVGGKQTNNGSTGNEKATVSSANDTDQNDGDDEPMDTTNMGQILAKVPAGTSVSTTIIKDPSPQTDNSVTTTQKSTHGNTDADVDDEEEEEDDEDLEDEEENANSTNPLEICNVNLSENEESQQQMVPHMDTSLQLSSATARAIAASTFASFNQMDLEGEASTSRSSPSDTGQNFNTPTSVTISSIAMTGGERRGRGRPPKYGSVFQPHPTSSTPVTVIPVASSSASSSASLSMASVAASTRSRRGRPPSMPEELLRSLTGRLDKAHHKCPHCPQIYYGYHAMRDHITSVHLNSGEKYICNLCNKEYTWRITLRKHLKFHHGVHPDQVPQV